MAATISGRHNFPFLSEYEIGGEIRTFGINVDDAEFVWHRDNEHREIEILEGEGWQFQYQNCLPCLLRKGMIFDIPEGEYHRLIKGYNTLKVRVIKRNG